MIIQMKEKYYRDRIEVLNKRLDSIKKTLGLLSVTRLITFILVIVALIYILKFSILLAIGSCFILLLIFVTQVKIFIERNKTKLHIERLIDINGNEIKALNYDYKNFADGNEYINTAHPYSFDLDIFGEGSLFQFLNRTSTQTGKDKLASWFSTPELNPEQITMKQNSIKELSGMIDCRQNFNASGIQYDESGSDLQLINKWLNEPVYYENKSVFKILSLLFPLITFLSMFAVIISSAFIDLFIVLFLMQLFITVLRLRYNNRIHSVIGKRLDMLRKYKQLFGYIDNESFKSEILVRLRNKLKYNNDSADRIIGKLAGLVSAFDNRLNIIAGVMLNGLFLWDIQCIMRLEKWKLRYKNKIPGWFDVLGEFDALSSLANYYFNFPGQVFPVLSDKTVLHAVNLGHPLINEKERVNNDIEIINENQFIIITGANMAGKSTFLRTVGVNLILGMCGAPVCASEFEFKLMKLYTSMRTSDSLQKHVSYFYAELKRLKELIEKLYNKNKLFILLDEILKGTNSEDKQRGSKVVLEQIIRLNGTGIIATHDLELAKSEEEFPENIKNKCFEIEINGEEIYFNYKLVDGITKKMNATLLMKQMGILI